MGQDDVVLITLSSKRAYFALKEKSGLKPGETVTLKLQSEGDSRPVTGTVRKTNKTIVPPGAQQSQPIWVVCDKRKVAPSIEPAVWSSTVLAMEKVSLAQLGEVIHDDSKLARRVNTPCKWRDFITYPGSKRAETGDRSFKFDDDGMLTSAQEARKALDDWLRPEDDPDSEDDPDIGKWIDDGTPSKQLFQRLAQRLAEDAISDPDLYNEPVCRLVRRSQLRFDPDYAAVYQLTPAQVQLLDKPSSDDRAKLNANQRCFRGLSESFLSLVAMFDSDLGGRDEKQQAPETKGFIRIKSKTLPVEGITPKELNRRSPLRYWTIPQTFAKSVFHMLIWQSLIIGEDLYHRKVPEPFRRDKYGRLPDPKKRKTKQDKEIPAKKRLDERLADYCVVVNRFNAARYRIADYGHLLRLLGNIAVRIYESADEDLERPVCKMTDVVLASAKDTSELFHPLHYQSADEHITPPGASSATLSIPFTSSKLWELAHRYKTNKDGDEGTKIRHVLQFLRDRMIELILWSRYQMEVRSVGMLPVQQVYNIQLDDDLKAHVVKCIKEYRRGGVNSCDFGFLKKPSTLGTQVTLHKVFDHRSIRSNRLGEGPVAWLWKAYFERKAPSALGELPRVVDGPAGGSKKPIGARVAAPSGLELSGEEHRELYRQIEPLESLRQMVWYYHRIRQSVRHLSKDKDYIQESHLARIPPEQMLEVRRYIFAGLENYALEFYLQRCQWAERCRAELAAGSKSEKAHREKARLNPARHPCLMRRGFKDLVYLPDAKYSFNEFLGESLPMFTAIHAHLGSITKLLTELYYRSTELPLASFTDVGVSEIRHLTSELRRIMRGLLVATHLQRQETWQTDLVSYLMSCRADCQRLFETIPRYYQTHRLRLVIFPVEGLVPDQSAPDLCKDAHYYPIACLPWSAGIYREFLGGYESIAHHVMATIHWSVRLHSLWYFVPRRTLRAISPMFIT